MDLKKWVRDMGEGISQTDDLTNKKIDSFVDWCKADHDLHILTIEPICILAGITILAFCYAIDVSTSNAIIVAITTCCTYTIYGAKRLVYARLCRRDDKKFRAFCLYHRTSAIMWRVFAIGYLISDIAANIIMVRGGLISSMSDVVMGATLYFHYAPPSSMDYAPKRKLAYANAGSNG